MVVSSKVPISKVRMRRSAVMKRLRVLLAITTAMFLGLALFLIPVATPISPVQAAITWGKYFANPVLEEDIGEWDVGGVGAASVILDGATYKMWYTGLTPGALIPEPAIGYATSSNALLWTKDGTTPVLTKGTSGAWDEDGVGSGSVIKEASDSYKMWYTGYQGDTPAIGYAESSNGTTWTNREQVTGLASAGAWDGAGVLSPSVIWDADAGLSGLYKMWYSGRSADSVIGSLEIGYAESIDGKAWTNPQRVLPKGASLDWDERGVGVGTVIKLGSTYHMWYTGYTGYNKTGMEVAIGYATSNDGISWTEDVGNPVLTEEGTTWEKEGVGAPSVTFADRTYRMWYSGLDSNFDPTVGYADYTLPRGGGGGGFGLGDVKPPRFSGISASGITETTADIYWETQEFSDSQVEYWASPSKFSELDETRVINHHVRLIGLTPGTTYYYKTMSRDKAGNLAVSEEYTFTALGTPPAAQVSALEITPGEVDIGKDVTISALVLNIGDATRSYEISLKIDNVAVATKEVTLDGGASELVTFTVSRDVAATYAVSIDGVSGSFTVKEAVPPPPPVVPPPVVPPPVAPPPVVPPPVVPPSPAVNWWIIGGIVAGIVAGATVVWLTIIRRGAE